MTACSKGKPEFRGVDISEVDYARDIQLPDHNGQQRSLKDFKGKVAVALAREMAGFAWAMLQTVDWPGEAPPKPDR